MVIYVTKMSGEKEPFDSERIVKSLKKVGAPDNVARNVVKHIRKQLYDGIPTKEILKIALDYLHKEGYVREHAKYNLRSAIMELGPAGYNFETYFAEILNHIGYGTKVRQILSGKCVRHEIDIVALDKNKKKHLMEMKFHNQGGIYTGLKEALYTWARFLDLNDSGNKFDKVWLVTNGKVSTDAMAFGKCRGMEVYGWKAPTGSIEKLIEKNELYPITVLKSLSGFARLKFAKANIVLIEDVASMDARELQRRTGLPLNTIEAAKEEIQKVLSADSKI
ncbi:MAG TPA: ATP cone domain-containing protein [Candidatus Nanoarchaeia archaeon]|nr:ATP cone domain-containing protein [Candidatus Nanoarchaeia archaeon]